METIQHHQSSNLKSRIINTELQVKYLACAHIDLKNELAVLHQMVKYKINFLLLQFFIYIDSKIT